MLKVHCLRYAVKGDGSSHKRPPESEERFRVQRSRFEGDSEYFLPNLGSETHTACIVRRGSAQIAGKGPTDVRNTATITGRGSAASAHRRVRPRGSAVIRIGHY